VSEHKPALDPQPSNERIEDMNENIKKHQQIGDAIAFAKKKLFTTSKAGGDLRRACDQFVIDSCRLLSEVVPEMRCEESLDASQSKGGAA